MHFTGHKKADELPPLYAFAGCFVLPSTREPWGLVVNEAMACGLPVLVSERCGCAEDLVVAESNGFTFNPSRALELTHYLHQISGLTSVQRTLMGKASARIIRNYSPANFGREIALIAELSRPLNRSDLSSSAVSPTTH